MTDQSIYINMISSEAYGGVRTKAFPFGKSGMANSLLTFLCSERSGRMNYLKTDQENRPPDPHNKNLEIEK